MKKAKKTIAGLLAATVLCAAFTGCSGKTAKDDGNGEVKWYFFSSAKSVNEDDIFEKAAEIVKDEVGVNLKLLPVESGDYSSKIQVLTASMEEFDIMFTSNWLNNYNDLTSKKMLMELDPYLDGEYKSLKELLPDYWWDGAKVNGKIYAVPNQQIAAREPCFSIPKRNFELLGINKEDYIDKATDYKGYLNLVEKYLKTVHEATGTYSELGAIWWDGSNLFGFEEVLGSQLPGAIAFKSDNPTKLINQYDTEEYRHYIKTRRRWVKEGLVQPDDGKVTFAELDNPNAVVPQMERINTYKPSVLAEVSQNKGIEHEMLIRTKPYLTTAGITATMNGISATSANPDDAMKVINLVNTNADLFNVLAWGLEGVNYDKISDNTIRLNQNNPYTFTAWNIGNSFLGYHLEGSPENEYEETETINKSADKSPLLGFSPDLTGLKSEIAGCNAAVTEFTNALEYGSVDVDSTYEAFMQKLKAAGADKIIEEVQSQIDSWLASK